MGMSLDPQNLPFNFFKHPWLAFAVGLPFCAWVLCRVGRLWFKHFPGRSWDNAAVGRMQWRIARDPSHPDHAYARKTLHLYFLGLAIGLLSLAWHAWLFFFYAR